MLNSDPNPILVVTKKLFSIILEICKKKYVCANEAPFMTKKLHKEITKKPKLRNIS